MNNQKNNNTLLLIAVLLGLLIIAYKVMFIVPIKEPEFDESAGSIERIEKILNKVENINFDTSITKDSNFLFLKSFEKPLISVPVGKNNPFSPN